MDPDLINFLMFRGRMPSIEDERKPWTYKGWLRAYVQLIQANHPAVPNRWGYITWIHEHQRWPEEPIPQIRFDQADPTVAKGLRDAVTIAGEYGKHGFGWEAFRRFVDWLAFGLGVADAPPQMPEKVHEALYRSVDLGPWMLHPWDYLGAFAAEKHASGWNPNAFYPTPHPVCEAMVGMQMSDAKGDTRGLTTLDCCVGTGRMLLHASNYSMFLFGQDIDGLMCTITLINGALYAPWLVCPPPDHLKGPGKRSVRRPPPRRKKRRRPPPRKA